MASFIGALLPVPDIRGPGGGAHRTPKSFLSEYSSQARAWERFRSFGQWVLRHDPFFLAGRRRARALLACNREAFEAIPDRLQHKVHLFPVNGISSDDLSILEEDAPSQQSRLDAPFQVFSAGKLLGLKGYGLAIRGFGRFAEGHPNAQFTIVGDGPEFPRLEVLVRHLGLGKQVRFERWMVREQLLARMRSCDVLLFPSLRDGGGAGVVEAMAAGKPVICLDLAGPGMHVTPECGIKIAPESPDQAVSHIAKALDRLCQDGDLRLQMGRNARQRAEQAYHWDRLGERLFEIYGQAVKS
jgi:glycosyltransferase involved in cell wall biosynthesis